jgi:hypothetical protein
VLIISNDGRMGQLVPIYDTGGQRIVEVAELLLICQPHFLLQVRLIGPTETEPKRQSCFGF